MFINALLPSIDIVPSCFTLVSSTSLLLHNLFNAVIILPLPLSCIPMASKKSLASSELSNLSLLLFSPSSIIKPSFVQSLPIIMFVSMGLCGLVTLIWSMPCFFMALSYNTFCSLYFSFSILYFRLCS